MNVNTIPYTSLWYDDATDKVLYIDQTRLPHELVILEMKTFDDGIRAITNMEVRGAPLIGVAAAFAMYVGMREPPTVAGGTPTGAGGTPTGAGGPPTGTGGPPPGAGGPPPDPLLVKEGGTPLLAFAQRLVATRPTAVNLAWSVNEMLMAAGVIPAKAGTATLTRTADDLTPGPSPALPAVAGEGGATAGLFVSRVTRHASRLSPAEQDDLTPGPSPKQRDDLTPGPSPALPAVAGEGSATAGLFASRVTRHASRLFRHASRVTRHDSPSLVTRHLSLFLVTHHDSASLSRKPRQNPLRRLTVCLMST
jgi:hypothetical protein